MEPAAVMEQALALDQQDQQDLLDLLDRKDRLVILAQ
jgi:hypothetical protein